MRAEKSDVFKKLEAGLSFEDKKAVTKDAFREVMDGIQGDVSMIKKYRIKRMHGTDIYWEGHLKRDLCFVFEREIINREEVITFHAIGHHNIYNIVKKR